MNNINQKLVLKARIVALQEDGNSERKIAEILGIPKSTVHDVISKYKKTNLLIRKTGS